MTERMMDPLMDRTPISTRGGPISTRGNAMPPLQSDGGLHSRGERPIGEIVVELWENTEKLVRQEITLASTELEGKMNRAKREVGAVAIGGAVLYAGVLALMAALVLLLAQAMPHWLSALLVGVLCAGGGYFMVRKNQPNPAELTPRRTIESIKQDVRTFTEATK